MDGNEPLVSFLGNLPTLKEEYLKKTIPLWKRYNITTPTAVELAKTLTRDKCLKPKKPVDDNKGEAGFDRLAVVLLQTTHTIVVFPPVNGDPLVLQRCLKHVSDKKYSDDNNAVIIFSPPFYRADVDNSNLLANFLNFKMNPATKCSVYTLVQNTNANRVVGCALQTDEDSKSVTPLINMLEPSYILYPFPRTVGSDIVGGFLFSGAAADEVDLPASNIPKNIGSVSDFVSRGLRGEIAIPPSIRKNDSALGKINPYKIYRFFGPNAYPMGGNKVLELSLKRPDNTLEVESTMSNEDKFHPTEEDSLALDGISYKIIDLGFPKYSVRIPNDSVRGNWLDLKFTIDEAALLNNLNLRPTFLHHIFGIGWSAEIASFLENMVNSNCFTEQDLLTNGECSKSSEFVNKIVQYYMENDSRLVQLREQEDAAAARHLQILKEQAFDKMSDATLAADASEEARKSKEKLLAEHAAAIGIDTTVDPKALAKDPYHDNRLILVPRETIEISPTSYIRINDGKHIMKVLATRKRDAKATIGEIAVTATDDKDGNNKLNIALTELIRDYPGWTFNYQTEDTDDLTARVAVAPVAVAPIAAADPLSIAQGVLSSYLKGI
jgi:hypothetical protein